MEEYLRTKAQQDAVIDHADEVRRAAEAQELAAASADRGSAEQALIYMQRDLEKANDTIKVLQGEKRTTEQVKLLYEEAKAEKVQLQKEAIQSATEAETLRRTLCDMQEKMRQQASGSQAQTQIANKLFEAEQRCAQVKEELQEKAEAWDREKTVLLQQIDQVNEIRETVMAAYERGRRAGEAEADQRSNAARVERDDVRMTVERLESDLRVSQGERDRLNERVQVIPELELAINDLRNARNTERAQHTTDHVRLREDAVRLQREADDWKIAYETAEKHKRAMQMQAEDVKKAYSITMQERASLEARIDLLQIQLNESKLAAQARPPMF